MQRPGREKERPILPLVHGGDDLTAIMDAEISLDFASTYLLEFERASSESKDLSVVAGRGGRFAACAGVAIVRPHFPFFSAYRLADELLESAKQVRFRVRENGGEERPCSALDFQVLLDSTATGLRALRAPWQVSDGKGVASLTGRPYLVTPEVSLSGCQAEAWWRPRLLSSLRGAVAALRAKDADGRRVLAASQVHELRRGLFAGRMQADSLLRQFVARHGANLGPLAAGGASLFLDGASGEPPFARLLDALEVEPFLTVPGLDVNEAQP